MMPNFPSNRRDSAQRGSTQRKVDPVVKGRVSQQNNVAQNVRNIGNDLFAEIIAPALKDMIFSFFNSGLRMMIFGGDDGYSPSRGPTVRRSYNQQYRGGGTRHVPSRRRRYEQNDSLENYQDVIFDDIEDAKAVLGKMMEYVHDREPGMATLGDLYSLAGLGSSNWTYERYGWTDLRGTRIETIPGGGFVIGFPPLEFFNN